MILVPHTQISKLVLGKVYFGTQKLIYSLIINLTSFKNADFCKLFQPLNEVFGCLKSFSPYQVKMFGQPMVLSLLSKLSLNSQAGMDYYRGRYPEPVFIIVSDDMAWAREMFLLPDVILLGQYMLPFCTTVLTLLFLDAYASLLVALSLSN